MWIEKRIDKTMDNVVAFVKKHKVKLSIGLSLGFALGMLNEAGKLAGENQKLRDSLADLELRYDRLQGEFGLADLARMEIEETAKS